MENAAWNPKKYRKRHRKIRFGVVPHIDKEFFGLGIEVLKCKKDIL
jgi:hypothetical protein